MRHRLACSACRLFHAQSYLAKERVHPRKSSLLDKKPQLTGDWLKSVQAAVFQNANSLDYSNINEPTTPDYLNNSRPRTTQYSLDYFSELKQYEPVLDDANHLLEPDLSPDAPQINPAPPFPNLSGEQEREKDGAQGEEKEDNGGAPSSDLSFTRSKLITRTLAFKHVSNQTANGKIQSTYVLSVAGDGEGLVGMGEGKHVDGTLARQKSVAAAIKNMMPIVRYERRTIYGDVSTRFHGVQLDMRARPPGFGVRANHHLFEVCRCAGIKDLSAKIWGSRNGMNVVKAFFKALHMQKIPDVIALERGRNIVDVRKSYFGWT